MTISVSMRNQPTNQLTIIDLASTHIILVLLTDGEVNKATEAEKGEGGPIKLLYEQLAEMKIRTASITSIINDLSVPLTPSEGSGKVEDSGSNTTKKQSIVKNTNIRLNKSSETLQKVKKLSKSVKELESALQKSTGANYYKNVAECLINVTDQLLYFEPYSAISHLKLIQSKVTAIQNEIGRQIQWTFREIGQLYSTTASTADSSSSVVNHDQMTHIQSIVDALGGGFRKDLMERFAQLQLIPYEKAFKVGSEFSGLDHLGKRFQWFDNLVKAAEERLSSVVPSSWRLSYYLFIEFTRRTKKHVTDVLCEFQSQKIEANDYVKIMLKTLRYVIKFENQMRAILNIPLTRIAEEADDVSDGGAEGNAREESVAVTFQDSIADAFDSYLGPYVHLEKDTLEKLMLDVLKEEEKPSSLKGSAATLALEEGKYTSCLKMFEYIKSSLKRCTEFSTGLTYLSLSKEFRLCFTNYSTSLKLRCPSPLSFRDSSSEGKVPQYELSTSKEELLYRIINTAEYCIDTIPALEMMMKMHINPLYEDYVDFNSQIDSFTEVISYCFNIIVLDSKEKIQEPLKEMRRTNWSTCDDVGDSSTYIKSILLKIGTLTPRVRKHVQPVYFQRFCMDLSTMILNVYVATLWKLKRVSKAGGGQLLVDFMAVKDYLSKLPNIKLPTGVEPQKISVPYKAFVATKTEQIENILKLISADDERLQEMFPILWPDGTQADLEKLVNMKKGSLLPIPGTAGVVFDKVGDTIKDSKLGKATASAVGDIKKNMKDGAKNMKSIFGEMSNAFEKGLGMGEDGSSDKKEAAAAKEPDSAVKKKVVKKVDADGNEVKVVKKKKTVTEEATSPKKTAAPEKKKDLFSFF